MEGSDKFILKKLLKAARGAFTLHSYNISIVISNLSPYANAFYSGKSIVEVTDASCLTHSNKHKCGTK